MKKGFTLIELLGVVIILALLVIITFPTVINFIKKSNDVIDDATLNLVYSALDNYINENENDFEKNNNLNSCVSFDDLIESGFLKEDLISNLDDAIINNKSIKVSFNNKYNYNIVDNSECKLTENQIKKIVNAYVVKIEDEVKEKSLENPDVNYDGFYSISNEGSTITSGSNILTIEKNGKELTEGTVHIVNNKVTNITNGVIDDNYIVLNGSNITSFPKAEKDSTLAAGTTFNATIKKFANSSAAYRTSDSIIENIEFYPSGLLPTGYTKESLNKLDHESVSTVKDEIIAYYNDDNKSVYVVSDNNIYMNSGSGYLFYYFTKLQNIKNLNLINTSKVTNMSMMFEFAYSLKKIGVENFNTSKVETMGRMFDGCSIVENLDVSGFNTSNVTNMGFMFSNCKKITSLDLRSFDTSKVSVANHMFYNDTILKKLDMRNSDFSKITDSSCMFLSVPSSINIIVKNIDAKNFIQTVSSTQNIVCIDGSC